MNKTARKGGKNKGRYALYLPKWCRYTSHHQTSVKRQIKANGKG